jgi:hypothetical protein
MQEQDHHTPVTFGMQVALLPTESIEQIDPDLDRVIEVSKVVPCPWCYAPVSVLEFSSLPGTRVYDAVRDAPVKPWHADLLTEHRCKITSIWDTYILCQVLERTRRHCCGCAPSLFTDVSFVVPCGRCGELIAPVRLDGAPVVFYRAYDLTCPPEMWLDRHTSPPEYLADLGHPHRCPSPKKEVHQ